MDFFEQLEKGRYGSFELKRQVGPNLLKGLLISLMIHSTVISSPFIIARLMANHSAVPQQKYTNVVATVVPTLVPMDPRPITSIPIKVTQPNVAPVIPVAVPPDQVDPVDNLPASQIDLINHLAANVPSDSLAANTTLAFTEPPTEDTVPGTPIYIPFEVAPQAVAGCPEPEFPSLARQAGMGGKVIVQVFVDKHGDVRKWEFAKVDPPGLGFNDEVAKVIMKWKFTPAIQQGSPVGVWVAVPFNFKVKK